MTSCQVDRSLTQNLKILPIGLRTAILVCDDVDRAGYGMLYVSSLRGDWGVSRQLAKTKDDNR